MSRLSILLVNRFFWPDDSATGQMASDLAFHLAGQGHTVRVLAGNLAYDGRTRFPDFEIYRDVAIQRTGLALGQEGSLAKRFLVQGSFHLATFARLLTEPLPDCVIVKTDPPLLGATVTLACLGRKARIVHWAQDVFPEILTAYKPHPLVRAACLPLKLLRNATWNQAATIVCPDAAMQRHLRQTLSPSASLVTLPNWLSPADAPPPQAPYPSLRAQWGYTEEHFVVGYSGNLGRVHDMDTLLGCLQHLDPQSPLRFLFVGEGALARTLRARLPENWRHAFQFRPRLPRAQLAAALAVPDLHWLCLHPRYRQLVSPSKLYAALASTRPLLYVGSPDDPIAELLSQHPIGRFIRHGDSLALALALAEFRDNPDLVSQTGARARAYFDAHCQASDVLERWHLLLTSLSTPAP